MRKKEEDRIHNKFKKCIEEEAIKSIEIEDLDSMQTYFNIWDRVEELSYELWNSDFYNAPISEELFERICDHIEPYLEDARSYLKVIIEDLLDSKSLGELMIKYNNLSYVFDNSTFLYNIDLFADIEIGSKKKELTK